MAGVICENFMLMKFWKLQHWNCLCEGRRGSFCISLLSWLSPFKKGCFLTWRGRFHRDSHPDIFGLGSYYLVRVERESLLMFTIKLMYSLKAFWIYCKYLSTHLFYGYTSNPSAGSLSTSTYLQPWAFSCLHFCH